MPKLSPFAGAALVTTLAVVPVLAQAPMSGLRPSQATVSGKPGERPATPSTELATHVMIPVFLETNFIGRAASKESVLGCTIGATTRLLQLRDPVAAHAHADLDETLYVVAGGGVLHVREETMTLAPGSLTVIPRGVPHATERRGRNPLVVLSTLAGAPCTAEPGAQSNR